MRQSFLAAQVLLNPLGQKHAQRRICPVVLKHLSSRILATRFTRESRCHPDGHRAKQRRQQCVRLDKAMEEHQ